MSHSEPKSAVERLAARFMEDIEKLYEAEEGFYGAEWAETWAQCMDEAQEFAREILHEAEYGNWLTKILTSKHTRKAGP